eukprot:29023-Chlamydomonas_euryale.AAC.16
MSPAPRGGPADAHSAGKARGQPARQEESIYAVQPWGDYAPHAGPVVRSYNVPISSGAASPAALSEGALPGAASRQHDSSQVRGLPLVDRSNAGESSMGAQEWWPAHEGTWA